MLKIGDKDAKGLYYGSSTVAKAFLGSKQVWPSLPYDAEVQWLQANLGTAAQRMAFKHIKIPRNCQKIYFEATAMLDLTAGPVNRNFLASFSDIHTDNYCEFNQTGQFGANNWDIWYLTPAYNAMRKVTMTLEPNHMTYTSENDGVTYTAVCNSGWLAAYAYFMLFALSWNSYIGKGMRCGAGKLYIEDQLVLDFIPVRFTNENGLSEGAMYDKVTKQLYRSSTPMSLVIGPDIKSSTRMLIDVAASLTPTDKYWIYPDTGRSKEFDN